jgi:hypothetical protein
VEQTRVALLGGCWAGLEPRHAADDVGGLTSVLLRKGLRAVIAGTGRIPVEVIAEAAKGLPALLPEASAAGTMAVVFRRQVAGHYQRMKRDSARAPHPLEWAALVYYGLPWRPASTGR